MITNQNLDQEQHKEVLALAKAAAQAAPQLSGSSLAQRNDAIAKFADLIGLRRKEILAANHSDAQGRC